MDKFPLSRGRQGNPQAPLQAFGAIERAPRTVLQQANHAGDRGIVFFRADALGRPGGKDLVAETATQPLKPINLGSDRGLAHEPDQHAGLGLFINRAVLTLRTRVARLKRFVRYLNLFRARIVIGPVATVASRRRLGIFCRIGLLR